LKLHLGAVIYERLLKDNDAIITGDDHDHDHDDNFDDDDSETLNDFGVVTKFYRE